MDFDVVDILFRLLPGFAAAWVFFGLTGFKPRSPFERIVHALILTAIIAAITTCLRTGLFWIGTYINLGFWNEGAELSISFIIALVLGVGLASAAHHDIPHRIFRGLDYGDGGPRFWRWVAWLRITRNRPEPSEWYGAFAEEPRYVTLHLKGGRRLYGWPRGWPNDPQQGHFVMQHAEWLLDDGTRAPLYGVKALLIDTREVEMVEFLKNWTEIEEDKGELDRVHQVLVNEQEIHSDGQETTAGTATTAQRP